MSPAEADLLSTAKRYLSAVGNRDRAEMLTCVVPTGSFTSVATKLVPEEIQHMIANVNFDATDETLLEKFSDQIEPLITVRGEPGKQIGVIVALSELYVGETLYLRGDVITTWVNQDGKWLMTGSADNLLPV